MNDQPDLVTEAVAAERKRAAAIFELCTLAGMPDLAAGFISGGTPLDAISAELLAAKASRQSPEIASHVDQDKTAFAQTQSNAVLDAVRKLFSKE